MTQQEDRKKSEPQDDSCVTKVTRKVLIISVMEV